MFCMIETTHFSFSIILVLCAVLSPYFPIIDYFNSVIQHLNTSPNGGCKQEGRPTLDMGNGESTYDDSRDDFHNNFHHQPPSYAGSSRDHNSNSSHQGFHNQPPSYAESSMDHNSRTLHRSTRIADNYNSLDEVVTALREAGLESSNLILGIDFTKSNEWNGRYSFHRKSLHSVSTTPNPYEQAISIIGRTLSPFDEDDLIPCFGFGDVTTRDKHVFSFYPDHRPCRGFEEVLKRYKEIIPLLNLSGPTSFAPIIDAAIDIVEKNNGQYHVLVIIADGQVTRNPDAPPGRLSPQEQDTVNSIVAASGYPLSIILVGVGDGPWDAMQQFDDNIPQRAFDNFQFVNFSKIMSEYTEASKKETTFALAALMEIPFQYRATLTLNFENREHVGGLRTRPLPPPQKVIDHDNSVKAIPRMIEFPTTEATSSAPASAEPVCPICLTNPRNMAFGCGHTTCKDCGISISTCPLCREPITTRLRLYN